jgi:hypothetical protein
MHRNGPLPQVFLQSGGALKNHQRNCKRSKKRLIGALAKAKEVWISRKRRHLEDVEDSVNARSSVPTSTVGGSSGRIDLDLSELATEAIPEVRA